MNEIVNTYIGYVAFNNVHAVREVTEGGEKVTFYWEGKPPMSAAEAHYEVNNISIEEFADEMKRIASLHAHNKNYIPLKLLREMVDKFFTDRIECNRNMVNFILYEDLK